MERSTVDTIKAMLPRANDEEIGNILWGETCFPGGDEELIIKQLQDYIDNGMYDMDTDNRTPWDENGCPYT